MKPESKESHNELALAPSVNAVCSAALGARTAIRREAAMSILEATFRIDALSF